MSATVQIRPAEVQDAPAITAIHCSNVLRWQVWEGQTTRPARYADLTPYQRWLHGGAWLDAGTCAFHLTRLAVGGGLALVAERAGRVLAEAECYIADEPAPYGRNLNLSILYVHRNYQKQGLGQALMAHCWELAQREGCDNFLIAHAEAPEFYRKLGFKLAERWRRWLVPVKPSKVTYTAKPLGDSSYETVRGWALPIGRYQNAHHDWERVRPKAVPDFAEWRDLKGERFSLKMGNENAVVAFEEQTPGVANTFVFTPIGYTPRLFSAVRDLGAKRGFAQLQCFAKADLVLPDAVKTDYVHQLFRKKVQ